MMVLFLAAACVPRNNLPDPDQGPFYDGDPVISSLSWECDAKASRWRVELETERWTNGGRYYMARDADTIERHNVPSIEADGEGAWDELRLTLDIVADFRDASPSSSTAYLCSDIDALSYLVTIQAPDGSGRTDCRTWGADPEIFDNDDIGLCETVFVPPEDTGS